MRNIEQFLAGKLEDRQQQGNLRTLSIDKATVDFFSNDYLGLVTNGTLAALIYENSRQGTTGSTGSRLISGNSVEAEVLESKIAAFHHAEAALIFNSGYDANVGLLSSIIHRDSVVLYDELCHASIIDGIRLSLSAKRYKFRHNDVNDLRDKLKKLAKGGGVLVVVESVYSMDGDMAPLQEIIAVCRDFGVDVIVDEAHATGVFGEKGEGLVCALNLHDQVIARVYTFGKALGAHGAAVVGSKLLRDYLINFARSFIYTTALPGHSIQAIDAAYRYLDSDDFTQNNLQQLIAYFRSQISNRQLKNWIDSHSPIQALLIQDNDRSKHMAAQLREAGMQVKAILHPTVPRGMERLRICLHTFNTFEQVDRLMGVIDEK